MSIYEKLADALNALPNGYPRTETGSDLKVLEYMYTEKEAELASMLTIEPRSVKDIATQLKKLPKEVQSGLLNMTRIGKVLIDLEGGRPKFRLAPFIVGSYEAYVDGMNEEFAILVENYLNDGGIVGIMKPQPAVHRVIPAPNVLDLEWILPHENVMNIIDNAQSFQIHECICRKQQAELGKGCKAPRNNCLSFTNVKRKPKEGDITKEEAIQILKESHDAGLIHSVSNVVDGLHYICNCCGCCCGILRGITDWGIENSMARANYEAILDTDKCINCKKCIKRCQVDAISLIDNKIVINRDKCLGCGLCVTTCPTDAIKMIPRPKNEQIEPPKDFGDWEKARLKDRGLV